MKRFNSLQLTLLSLLSWAERENTGPTFLRWHGHRWCSVTAGYIDKQHLLTCSIWLKGDDVLRLSSQLVGRKLFVHAEGVWLNVKQQQDYIWSQRKEIDLFPVVQTNKGGFRWTESVHDPEKRPVLDFSAINRIGAAAVACGCPQLHDSTSVLESVMTFGNV